MEGLKFINFGDPYNRWPLDKVIDIATKVKEYTDRKGIQAPELFQIEDVSWEKGEEVNKRVNIRIRYHKDGKLYEKWLMIMKGKCIDCNEFHERRDEFYPVKEV